MQMRASTIVREGNSLTATPLKKKEPPQSTDSAISMVHSWAAMGAWVVGADGGSVI
jgi:hypothetical protein